MQEVAKFLKAVAKVCPPAVTTSVKEPEPHVPSLTPAPEPGNYSSGQKGNLERTFTKAFGKAGEESEREEFGMAVAAAKIDFRRLSSASLARYLRKEITLKQLKSRIGSRPGRGL